MSSGESAAASAAEESGHRERNAANARRDHFRDHRPERGKPGHDEQHADPRQGDTYRQRNVGEDRHEHDRADRLGHGRDDHGRARRPDRAAGR